MPAGMPPMQGGAPPGPVEQPPSITRAVLLMRVGAALSLVASVATLLMRETMRDLIEKAATERGTTISSEETDLALNVGLGFAVLGGLIGAGLWLWMAWANGKGAPWARIVATVLFGFSLLSGLAGLLQPEPLPTRLLALLGILVGGSVIVLLYRRDSSEFYRARSAPRF
jgi:hypothetical protein